MRSLLAVIVVTGCAVPPAPPDAGAQVVITTISGANGAPGAWADGDAQTGRYNMPEGLALDVTGEQLYVADAVNHVIRKLDLASGALVTVAGRPGQSGFADSDADGGALLALPRNLVLGLDGGSLFFTDTGNSVIRRLALDTLKVTTEFGTAGTPGAIDGVGTDARFGRKGFFSVQAWGGGLAIDRSSPTPVMYVADSANQTIRAIDLTTRAVTTIAGVAGVEGAADGPAATATFNKPSGLLLDGRSLYVTEANNLTIRRLDLDARVVVTVAGKAPENPRHYCEDISPMIPPECGSNDSARGTEARFRFPFGVAADERHGFFVVDSHNNLIRRFDIATSAVTTVAGTQKTVLDDLERPSEDSSAGQAGGFSHPSHVVFVPPRTLYVADRSANCIKRVDLAE